MKMVFEYSPEWRLYNKVGECVAVSADHIEPYDTDYNAVDCSLTRVSVDDNHLMVVVVAGYNAKYVFNVVKEACQKSANKVQAIKYIEAQLGIALAEAKGIIETYMEVYTFSGEVSVIIS